MKRFLLLVTILSLIFSLCIPAMAETIENTAENNEKDLYYFMANDPAVKAEIKNGYVDRAPSEKAFIEKNVLKPGEEFDLSLVSYRTDEVYTNVWWTNESYVKFIEAKTTEERLNLIKEHYFSFLSYPIYYNGQKVDGYEVMMYMNEDGVVHSHIGNTEGYVDYSPEPYIASRTKMISEFEKQGITGYNLLNAANFDGIALFLAEKNGEECVLVYCHKDYLKSSTNQMIYDREKELIEKKILTKAETKQLLETKGKVSEEWRNGPYANMDFGYVENKYSFPYWIIGVIVGVTAIAAVTVIVIKKKKA